MVVEWRGAGRARMLAGVVDPEDCCHALARIIGFGRHRATPSVPALDECRGSRDPSLHSG
jgi:hypothetical protein